MKKLYALLLFVVSAGMLNAQYYLLPAYDVGFNPGELNSDPEQTEASLASGSYGWTTIMNSTTTDTWSSSQALPFSFNFNGNAVTSYQVSNAGVLTFSSSPGMAPPTTPSALPSVLLPDKSICAWGINIGGANDAILSKTFGTAPNRQHWVFFSSASHPALGAGSWTYWGIVLEESTDKIYVVDQRTYSPTGTANVAVTVGIQTSVGSVIQVPPSPNVSSGTTATGGSGDDPSDNTWYEFAFGTQANYDIAGVGHTIPQLVQTGSANSLTLKLWNRGAFNINSMDLNYRINGGAAVTTSLSSLNIGSGDFYEIAHPTAWTPPTDAFYTIEAWASNLNGNSDGVNSNDTITIQVRAVANPPERIVVIEEKTGTWCGWCPRGLIGMDYMTTQYPNSVVGIAVHNADPMVVGTYDANIGTVAPGGYPGSAVDRILGPDPNNVDLEDAYNERQGVLPQATVGISGLTYNATNGQISVDVSAEFFADFNNADLRFVMVLTEDSVTGSSSGYAQANYYSFQSQNIALTGYGRNWQTSPSTIPASEMHYDHVARGIYPNFFG
ncbi:MAG TPA: hypothetical protein DIU20_11030, partial [Cryomorphaceae bacterium]|nr:hypothetical protein [Cryomorphaceae bacterium]